MIGEVFFSCPIGDCPMKRYVGHGEAGPLFSGDPRLRANHLIDTDEIVLVSTENRWKLVYYIISTQRPRASSRGLLIFYENSFPIPLNTEIEQVTGQLKLDPI